MSRTQNTRTPTHLGVALLCLLLPSLTWGNQAPRIQNLFSEGNRAYEAGDYQQAVDQYQQILTQGIQSADLFFNYANALFRLERLGEAILYYERAAKLEPAASDVQFNLRFANGQIQDKITEPESNWLTRVLYRAHSSYPINTALWSLLAVFALLFISLGGLLFCRGLLRLSLLATLVLLCFFFLVALPSVSYRIYQAETQRFAIVLAESVSIRSGPGDNFQVLAKIHEGTKCEIVEEKGEWTSIKLPNGKGGFVSLSALGMI